MSTSAEPQSAAPVQLSLVRMEHQAERLHAARRWQREHKKLNRFPKPAQVDQAVARGWGRGWKNSGGGDSRPRYVASDVFVFDERRVAPNQVAWFRRVVGEPQVTYLETEEQFAARRQARPHSVPERMRKVSYPTVRMSGIGQDLAALSRAANAQPRYGVDARTLVGMQPAREHAPGERFRIGTRHAVVFLAAEVVSNSPWRMLFQRQGWLIEVARSDVRVLPSFNVEAVHHAHQAQLQLIRLPLRLVQSVPQAV